MPKRVSVIATVRNEADRIDFLLQSLQGQANLHQVILVDAQSTDDTVERARAHAEQLPLEVVVQPCARGEGRNIGARRATGDVLAFIDGDCVADPNWVTSISEACTPKIVVAGATEHVGPFPANRLPILVDGIDVTWPSCNLAYHRKLFEKLGGFDKHMQTAEDIDLNVRAVQAGAGILHVPEAKVHAHTRSSLAAHLRQAFAYGVGRRQLLERHPQLPVASKRAALRGHASPRGILRLAWGWAGYRFGGNS